MKMEKVILMVFAHLLPELSVSAEKEIDLGTLFFEYSQQITVTFKYGTEYLIVNAHIHVYEWNNNVKYLILFQTCIIYNRYIISFMVIH